MTEWFQSHLLIIFSWATFYSFQMVDSILFLALALIVLKMNAASIFIIVESKVIGRRFDGSLLIFSGVWGSFLVRLLFLICCWIYLQLFLSIVLGAFLIISTAIPSHLALFWIFKFWLPVFLLFKFEVFANSLVIWFCVHFWWLDLWTSW